MSIYDYDVEFVRGVDNEMADWLFRSTNRIDHLEETLKWKFVINKVKTRQMKMHPNTGKN